MRLVERDEPGKVVEASMALLSLKMARSANPASPACFASSRFTHTRSDVLLCKLGAQVKQKLFRISALEPVGVPV